MQVLLISPGHDIVNHYLRAWSKKLYQTTKNNTEYIILDGGDANRSRLESVLKKRRVDVVLLNGHGAGDKLAGINDEVILDLNNVDLLRDKKVHALSCQTARVLGPSAMRAGAKCYIGYDEDFAIVTSRDKISHPTEDATAALFLDPAFAAPRALLKGKTASEAVEIAINEYDKSIAKALNSDVQSADDQFVKYLIGDRDHLQSCAK